MGVSSLNQTVRLLKGLFDSRVPASPPMKYCFEKPKIQPTSVKQPFLRCQPEETGVSSLRIQRFIEKIVDDPELNMHSLIALKDGKIIAEASFGAQRIDIAKYTFSQCKSIVSLVIGILIDEGKLSLNEKIIDIFKDKVQPLARVQHRDLTVEDLLTMRSGVLFNEAFSMTTTEWVKGFVNASALGKVGDTFTYNSLNTYMLVAIAERKCGMSFQEYLNKKLFEPLGIDGTYWEKSPEGLEKGGWGLYMRPENAAKLGQLVMNGGIWNGKQIVSKEYIKKATSAHAIAPERYGGYNYGYQIWCGRKINSFLFNGMLGQNIIGFRDSGIILVSNGGNDENFQQSNYFKYAAGFFADPIKDDLSDAKKNYHNLEKYIAALSAVGKKQTLSEKLLFRKYRDKFLGKRFVSDDENAVSTGLLPVLIQAVENTYTKGFKSLRLSMRGSVLYLTYAEKNAIYDFPIGLEKPIESDVQFEKLSYRIAAKGVPAKDEDNNFVLKIRVDFIETPFSRLIKLRFTDRGVLLEQMEQPGAEYVIDSVSEFSKELPANMLVEKTTLWLEKEYVIFRANAKFCPVLHLHEGGQ